MENTFKKEEVKQYQNAFEKETLGNGDIRYTFTVNRFLPQGAPAAVIIWFGMAIFMAIIVAGILAGLRLLNGFTWCLLFFPSMFFISKGWFLTKESVTVRPGEGIMWGKHQVPFKDIKEIAAQYAILKDRTDNTFIYAELEKEKPAITRNMKKMHALALAEEWNRYKSEAYNAYREANPTPSELTHR